MKKEPFKRFISAMNGRGFYIVLFLCVAAIGISGYYLLKHTNEPSVEAAAPTPVTVSSTPMPAKTSVAPTATPTPKPSPTPTPKPTVTPVPSGVKGTPPVVASPYTWPVSGQVQKKFSMESLLYSQTMRDWRTHSGIDLTASVGTGVKAVSGGVVDAVYQDDMMGTCVVIEHADDVKSLYANLAEQPTVKVGDRVSTGDVIGAVGNTALFESSEASHLHLEIYENGEVVDPETVLPER